MGQDPHVHTADGHLVDIYLPIQTWTLLLTGPTFGLTGRVFARDSDNATQWFDGIRLVDTASDDVIFEAVIPRDVELGAVGPEVQYVRATLAGTNLTKTDATYEAGDVQVVVSKLSSAVRSGRNPIFNDKFAIKTPDFNFVLVNARETNRDNYDTLEEQLSETHIDLSFGTIPDTQQLAGPLADIIWGDRSDAALPDETKALMSSEPRGHA